MYDEAIAEKELNYSPMYGVVLHSKSICTVPAKETFSLTPQQIKTLKDICLTKNQDGTYKYRYGLIVLLMLNLGVRVDEMLVLDFQDFNETDKVVKISKSFQSNTKYRGEDKYIKRVCCIKEPKTKNSNRVIPYGKEVDRLLQDIKEDN